MTETGRQIIRMIVWPLMLTFFIVYVTYYEVLKGISLLFINMAPSLVLVIGGVLIWDQNRGLVNRRKAKGEFEQLLTLSQFDIWYLLFTMYFTFISILIIPLVFKSEITLVDVGQGMIAFLAVWWVKKRYFHFSIYKNFDDHFEIDNTIVVTVLDSMKLDALSFASAILIVGVPGIILQNLHVTDIFQASVSFIAIYLINTKYFKFNT